MIDIIVQKIMLIFSICPKTIKAINNAMPTAKPKVQAAAWVFSIGITSVIIYGICWILRNAPELIKLIIGG